MYSFDHYLNLKQIGYDPSDIGKGYLQSIRQKLNEFRKRIREKNTGEVSWYNMSKQIDDIYSTLCNQKDISSLHKGVLKGIEDLKNLSYDNRLQESMRSHMLYMLAELERHLQTIS